MTSNRLIPIQHVFDFVDEAERPSAVSEPQRGQSDLAAMKKTALGSTSENLMERIVELRNIERAWRKVKANGGAPGPDGVDLDEFFRTFRDRWPTVRQQLLEGTYEPAAARRKSIPKPDGSQRHLGTDATSDWPILASRRDGRSRPATLNGRYDARRSTIATPCQHPAG